MSDDEQQGGDSRGFFQRLRERLNPQDSWLSYDLANVLPGRRIDEDTVEELETRLLMADVGVAATAEIIEAVEAGIRRKELETVESLLGSMESTMVSILEPVAIPLEIPAGGGAGGRTFVILVVGVNGAGKTTTIAKLARRFRDQGRSVMLAAADTFRAAAVEQIRTWGERNDVPVIAQGHGADPGAVAFDALQAAHARGTDVLIVDTAGRLHTQDNLMEELRKIRRVIAKLDEDAPHETLLVLDANQGQNALAQARQFDQAVDVTGIAVTKLDGSARGGILLAIARELRIPVRFVGFGEAAEDLGDFDAAEYVRTLLRPGMEEDAA